MIWIENYKIYHFVDINQPNFLPILIYDPFWFKGSENKFLFCWEQLVYGYDPSRKPHISMIFWFMSAFLPLLVPKLLSYQDFLLSTKFYILEVKSISSSGET
mgnify:CR=1 FL=1